MKNNNIEKKGWQENGCGKLIVAGPCSAESEEQLLHTAQQIAAIDNKILYRAGIWKPRTKPGGFEGMGEMALPWMKRVKAETGLEIATEVANARHVYECIKHEIDWVWIGARTTVNPFSVQEIADALQGSRLKVMIKNPVNTDTELWCGAVERILKAGIKNPVLIHRGFSSYLKTDLRNEPVWSIPIEMMRRFPGMKIICDPSHISGRREKIREISQAAIDLNFSGLMIETHHDPEKALSDAQQQVTPGALEALLNELAWKREKNGTDELAGFRNEIDQLDDFLLILLGKRMKVAEEIGRYKKAHSLTVLQNNRWSEVVDSAVEKGAVLGLEKNFILKYLDVLHIESINRQQKIIYEK